jgi:hypothetical protein
VVVEFYENEVVFELGNSAAVIATAYSCWLPFCSPPGDNIVL